MTGGGGFLGRRVVTALLRRGHEVRVLDLPGSSAAAGAPPGVEEVAADLCHSQDLARACAGVGAVIHLAARLEGDAASIVATAVDGTRLLLDAMELAGAGRMVLASSLSVYDWAAPGEVVGEESPLEPHPEARDGYTTAKLRQELLARERCRAAGIALTVLRPGALWGPGREVPPTVGQRVGPLHLVPAAGRRLPAVHVENCADAFAAVLDLPARDETFDVVDHPGVTAGRFLRDHLARSGRAGVVLPVPYRLGRAAAALLQRLTPGPLRPRLPSFVAPPRFAARYRPARIDGARLRVAGWRPPLDYAQCLDLTYGARAAG